MASQIVVVIVLVLSEDSRPGIVHHVRNGEQVATRSVPHPCQNKRAQTVIGGHSGDVHGHDDLDSGSYPRYPNKPDKEAVGLLCDCVHGEQPGRLPVGRAVPPSQ